VRDIEPPRSKRRDDKSTSLKQGLTLALQFTRPAGRHVIACNAAWKRQTHCIIINYYYYYLLKIVHKVLYTRKRKKNNAHLTS